MDLNTFKAKRPALERDLKEVFARHGMSMGIMNGRIGTTESEIKIKVSDAGVNPAVERWNRTAEVYGLKKEWLGQTFRYGHERYRIEGLLDRARSDKIVSVTCLANGKPYVFPYAAIPVMMNAAAG